MPRFLLTEIIVLAVRRESGEAHVWECSSTRHLVSDDSSTIRVDAGPKQTPADPNARCP